MQDSGSQGLELKTTDLHILTGRVHDMALYIYTKTLRVLNLMKTLV